MTVAIVQPIGQASHIPVAEPITLDSTIASTTLSIRSVNVDVMNLPIMPVPLSIPSATSFADTTK